MHLPTAAIPGDNAQHAGRSGLPLIVTLSLALCIPAFSGVTVITGWAWYHFRSRTAVFAFLHGRHVLLDPQSFDLGTVRPKEKRVLTIRAVNLTGQDIAIHGVQSYCTGPNGCVLCKNRFPIVIRPRESDTLSLEYEFKGRPEARSFLLMAEVFTEIGNFEITLRGEIEGGGIRARP
jgi:hypothetical protein